MKNRCLAVFDVQSRSTPRRCCRS